MLMGAGRRYRWPRLLLLGSLGCLLLAAVFLVLVSPLALPALDRAGSRDWQRLSDIGQTYGAVSALLSVVALGGVVASLVLQTQQTKLDRLQAHRSFHLQLLKMAIDDPDLHACWGSIAPDWGSLSPVERRQFAYCNQVVSFMEMSFDVGTINEAWLRGAAQELFGSAVSRQWWQRNRQALMGRAAWGSPALRILDEEWEQAMSREQVTSEVTAQEAPDETNEVSKTEKPTPADRGSRAADAAD